VGLGGGEGCGAGRGGEGGALAGAGVWEGEGVEMGAVGLGGGKGGDGGRAGGSAEVGEGAGSGGGREGRGRRVGGVAAGGGRGGWGVAIGLEVLASPIRARPAGSHLQPNSTRQEQFAGREHRRAAKQEAFGERWKLGSEAVARHRQGEQEARAGQQLGSRSSFQRGAGKEKKKKGGGGDAPQTPFYS